MLSSLGRRPVAIIKRRKHSQTAPLNGVRKEKISFMDKRATSSGTSGGSNELTCATVTESLLATPVPLHQEQMDQLDPLEHRNCPVSRATNPCMPLSANQSNALPVASNQVLAFQNTVHFSNISLDRRSNITSIAASHYQTDAGGIISKEHAEPLGTVCQGEHQHCSCLHPTNGACCCRPGCWRQPLRTFLDSACSNKVPAQPLRAIQLLSCKQRMNHRGLLGCLFSVCPENKHKSEKR